MKELERQQKEVRPRLWGVPGLNPGRRMFRDPGQRVHLCFVEIVCVELMLIIEKPGKNTDRGKDFISVKPA